MAVLLLVFVGMAYGTAWLVGLGLRFAPLVGRRHRNAPLIGRQPIETESSKHWSERATKEIPCLTAKTLRRKRKDREERPHVVSGFTRTFSWTIRFGRAARAATLPALQTTVRPGSRLATLPKSRATAKSRACRKSCGRPDNHQRHQGDGYHDGDFRNPDRHGSHSTSIDHRRRSKSNRRREELEDTKQIKHDDAMSAKTR